MTRALVTFAAQYLILLPPVVSLAWLIGWASPRQRRPYLGLLVLGGLLSLLLARLGSALIGDPRPFLVDGVRAWFPASTDNGFPSDHTLLATVFAAALWPFHRGLSGCLYAVALLIGAARVAAGVHHGLDVAGAMLIGTVGVVLAGALLASRAMWAPVGGE